MDSSTGLKQKLERIGNGAVIIDEQGCIQATNRLGLGYMAILADAGLGSTLHRVGNRCLCELLAPLPKSDAGHPVSLAGPPQRDFEVTSKPVSIDQRTAGWLLLVRDVTK